MELNTNRVGQFSNLIPEKVPVNPNVKEIENIMHGEYELFIYKFHDFPKY